MKTPIIGYDDNLGLPSDFKTNISCELVSYHNLTQLITDFSKNELDLIFIPAGTLPYLKDYSLLAQAIFSANKKDMLETDFVTTKHIDVQNISQYSLGRVNRYCTTSYWAPLIYLMPLVPQGTTLNFNDTNGFKDMLDKTAKGEVDGSMVWKIILKENPGLAENVHLIFSKSDLPTPVLVSREENFSDGIAEKIYQFTTTDEQSFFSSFKKPNLDLINNFLLSIKEAISFYNISL